MMINTCGLFRAIREGISPAPFPHSRHIATFWRRRVQQLNDVDLLNAWHIRLFTITSGLWFCVQMVRLLSNGIYDIHY